MSDGPELTLIADLDQRCAAIADKPRRLLAIQHELAQDTNTEQDNSANVVCPLKDLVPARAIVRHVSKAFVLQEAKKIMHCAFALESNAYRTAEAWTSSQSQVRLLTDSAEFGYSETLQYIEARRHRAKLCNGDLWGLRGAVRPGSEIK